MANFTLSKKEMELMQVLWDADSPLSRQEILDRAAAKKCSWKPNSVHILLNSLLEKKSVRVAGYYLNARKLGRSFEPNISREKYAVMQVEIALKNAKALAGLEPKDVLQQLAGSR